MLATRDADAIDVDRPAPAPSLGQLPLIAFLAGVGVLVCSVDNALSRATLGPPEVIYWAGILIIGLPAFWRLGGRDASPGERLTLVCLLGMALYAVKLTRDSGLFSIPDEFIHAYNADQIVRNDELFGNNPILPISADFPGLEGATSGLMNLTGMSSYGAGVMVIGAARLALLIGLFVLFRRISGSARIAGLGAGIYVCNFNFMFFDGQYSYESLALPLLVVVLMALAEREAMPQSWSPAWAGVIVLLTGAIVVTHHLTSYVLAASLAVLALLYWWPRRKLEWPNPWPFAVLGVTLCVVWLALVAGDTAGYLSGVIGDAISAAFKTASGAEAPRALFESDTGRANAPSTPLIARAVGISSVLLLAAALPFGLRELWRRRPVQPFVLLFGLAAIAFFGALGLRFISAAWETGSRATEFLFIGLAFVVAWGFVFAYSWLEGRGPRSAPWLGRASLTAGLGLVLAGGMISGWPWDAHLAPPIRAEADGDDMDSEPLGMAEWVAGHLPGQRFAASNADARLILIHGKALARPGRQPDIEDLLITPGLEGWQLPLLRRYAFRYVVSDRTRRSTDTTRGYSFSVHPPAGSRDDLFPPATVLKWDKILPAAAITSRTFDSGKIVIYDTEGRRR